MSELIFRIVITNGSFMILTLFFQQHSFSYTSHTHHKAMIIHFINFAFIMCALAAPFTIIICEWISYVVLYTIANPLLQIWPIKKSLFLVQETLNVRILMNRKNFCYKGQFDVDEIWHLLDKKQLNKGKSDFEKIGTDQNSSISRIYYILTQNIDNKL